MFGYYKRSFKQICFQLRFERTEAVCGTHGKRQIVRGVEQHLKMLFLPAYVGCIVEPPAGERQRSVVHGSAGNELVGRSSMMQLGREGFETSTIAVYTRSVV